MLPTMASSHQPSFADQLRSTCRAVLASIEDKGRLEPPIFPTALGEPAEATAEAPAVAPALARAPAGEWLRTGRNRLIFVPFKLPVPGALVPPEVPLVSSLSGQPRLHCGPFQLPRSQKPRCRKRCYACCRMRGQPGTPPFPPRCCLKKGHGLKVGPRKPPRMPCCHCEVCFHEEWISNPSPMLSEAL
jgi:hypothetical protein